MVLALSVTIANLFGNVLGCVSFLILVSKISILRCIHDSVDHEGCKQLTRPTIAFVIREPVDHYTLVSSILYNININIK